MTSKCPRCFKVLTSDLFVWECAGSCAPGPDREGTAYTGAPAQVRPLSGVQRPSDARRGWAPSADSGRCPKCRQPGREVCPHCHFPLLPGWRGAQVVCVALAGARATGKSVFIAVMIKQLEQLLGQLRLALSFADQRSHEIYEQQYERHLYLARGLIPPTAAAAAGDSYTRSPMILKLGALGGEPVTYLVLRDVAGEDMEHPAGDGVYLSYFSRADAVYFMFDPSAVTEVRELLRDYLPQQRIQVGDPGRALESMLRLVGGAPVPIAMILSKFDTMQALAEVDDARWRQVMANPGAAFRRDPGPLLPRYDEDDGALLHEEVRSLLHLLNAQRFVNALIAPGGGPARGYRFFTVSALGGSATGTSLNVHGIAPYRCLDPVRWTLSRRNLL